MGFLKLRGREGLTCAIHLVGCVLHVLIDASVIEDAAVFNLKCLHSECDLLRVDLDALDWLAGFIDDVGYALTKIADDRCRFTLIPCVL